MKDSNQTIMKDLNTAEFPLNEYNELNLEKINAKDSYWLFIINSDSPTCHTGPRKWSNTLAINDDKWKKIINLLKRFVEKIK